MNWMLNRMIKLHDSLVLPSMLSLLSSFIYLITYIPFFGLLGIASLLVYNVSVTDSSGCNSISNITISEPAALIATTSSIDPACGASDGFATVTVSGGTGSYTYLWDDPGAQTTATTTGVLNRLTTTPSTKVMNRLNSRPKKNYNKQIICPKKQTN